MDGIPWRRPWRQVVSDSERAAVHRQLVREICTRPLHPLWGKRTAVIGRRIDNDDVLVRLRNGSLATVHLGFDRRITFRIFERFFPHTTMFERVEDFIAQMAYDGEEYDA
jgi:hypothetical protein